MLLNNHFELEILQSFHATHYVLISIYIMPSTTYIHNQDDFGSEKPLVEPYKSIDLALNEEKHSSHPLATCSNPCWLQVQLVLAQL